MHAAVLSIKNNRRGISDDIEELDPARCVVRHWDAAGSLPRLAYDVTEPRLQAGSLLAAGVAGGSA